MNVLRAVIASMALALMAVQPPVAGPRSDPRAHDAALDALCCPAPGAAALDIASRQGGRTGHLGGGHHGDSVPAAQLRPLPCRRPIDGPLQSRSSLAGGLTLLSLHCMMNS